MFIPPPLVFFAGVLFTFCTIIAYRVFKINNKMSVVLKSNDLSSNLSSIRYQEMYEKALVFLVKKVLDKGDAVVLDDLMEPVRFAWMLNADERARVEAVRVKAVDRASAAPTTPALKRAAVNPPASSSKCRKVGSEFQEAMAMFRKS